MCSGQRRPWCGVDDAANGIAQQKYWTEVCFDQISILFLQHVTMSAASFFFRTHYYFQNAINMLVLYFSYMRKG